MTRLLRFGIYTVPLFGLLLLPVLWVEMHGFVSDATVQMWAKTILQVEGPQAFRGTDPFYPPLPYAVTLVVQALVPRTGIPVPLLVSAAIGALLLYAWFGNLRERGAYDRVSAGLIVALLAMNPFFLRALVNGPGTMFLLLGFWIYARGLLNLRLNGTAPDMMKVAVGLLIMPVSHGYGLMLTLGTLPFIVIAARPSMLAASSFGYIVSMFFPAVAAIGSLVFVASVLDTEIFPAGAVAAGARFEFDALLPTLCALAVVAAALWRTRGVPRFFLPLLAGACSLIGGAVLNLGYGLEADPVVVAAPALGLVIVAIRSWPPSGLRASVIAAVLVASVPLGLWSIRAGGGAESLRLLQAARGVAVADTRAADRAAAAYLAGRDGVLADVERNPGLVTAMGRIDGLLVAGQTAYDVTLQGGRPRGDWIAVRHLPDAVSQPDRLLGAFPQLAEDGSPAFALRFSHAPWRIFQIIEQD
ncbi:hypothetical protein [Limimaricola hongkongensis]|uniref:Glycosyltransferase RgtA/B/C/D-like domain-containing protein n=1 Tax=Limimaricola hongkongensis DSM 17492 TaxID=1122180 RepID=A0A017HDE8_9RHOB|nr:hypothetical protein [Limimaricola hongkongensis]EYD72507.1 hypothetical protein Lokhon_01308 [Limimaricola hongkongensis DSM 17492]